MSKPTVSIIVPSYNCASYLPAAMDSLLAQTFDNFEVVIIDDGSTDNTPEVINDYLAEPRVTFHRQKNSGPAAARNKAASLARGDFLAQCDADDLWKPDKLQKQMAVFADDPDAGLVYCNIATIDEQGEVLRDPANRYTCHEGWVTKEIIQRNFIPGPTPVIKKACFLKTGGYDTTIASSEDYELWLRLSQVCRFRHINESLYLYRRHASQASTAAREKQFFAHIDALHRFQNANPDTVSNRDISKAVAEVKKDLGHYYLRTRKDIKSARKTFIEAIRLNPLYLSAWNRLLKSYLASS